MSSSRIFPSFSSILFLFAGLGPASAADALPSLGASAERVTVSGVSSGGFMAVQMHVAHSATVGGAGVLAGGPYYCAQGSLWYARLNCMHPGAWTPPPPPALLKAEVETLAQHGQIDAPQNLAQGRAWLFTGTNDRTVHADVVQALGAFYALYGIQAALVANQPAGHAMVTDGVGNPCASTEPPFLNDCGYDAAGELLKHVLGSLQPAALKEGGRMVRFDQKAFAGGDARAISLADDGYVYVPKHCEAERCRVHVAFHGCRQNAAAVGERFVREAGYNRWADSNRLVVLYPQTIARYFPVFNPRGCWDWWGYTNAAYATKAGPQIRAVKAMIDRLAAARG